MRFFFFFCIFLFKLRYAVFASFFFFPLCVFSQSREEQFKKQKQKQKTKQLLRLALRKKSRFPVFLRPRSLKSRGFFPSSFFSSANKLL